MKRFVEFTKADSGRKVIVNVALVNSIEVMRDLAIGEDRTYLNFGHEDYYIKVKETYEEVKKHFGLDDFTQPCW